MSLTKKKNKKRSPRSEGETDSDSESEKSVAEKKDSGKTLVSGTDKNALKNSSEPEEGEVSDSSSSEEEFNDGYDDQLMGDEEDRARLASLTEKERETEIFKRIEQRELMKTRYLHQKISIYTLADKK